jgi:hypothetical protein
MSQRHKSRILPLLILSLICLGLAMVVYRQIEGLGILPEPLAYPIAVMTKSESLPPEVSLSFPSRATFSEVVARPIFSPTRRPAVAAAEAEAGTVSEVLNVDLVGVVIWPSQRLALVRTKESDSVQQVPEGGAVSGWTIVTIEPGRVVLRQGDSEQELRLTYKIGKEGE